MFRKLGVVLVLSGFLFALSGCATSRKQKDLEIQGLKNQITVLESQIQSRDQEISSLREAATRAEGERSYTAKGAAISEAKSRPNAKLIQQALKNAGYNIGAIDGKMGRQTRDAIRAFQKANNLHADGRVGKKTWVLLKEYLDKKIK